MTAIKSEQNGAMKVLDERVTSWRSIYIAAMMLLLCGVNMSIYYMAVWPYTKMVKPDTDISIYGWIVGANSLGCLVGNPLFGWWAQKRMNTVEPVGFGFAISALGNLLYALLPIVPQWTVISLLMASRFMCGVGAGTLPCLRSFAATSSTSADRLKAIALVSTGLTIGLSIGPVIQLVFMPVGPVGIKIFGLHIHQYSSPGFFMCVICALAVVLLITVFEENNVGIISDDEKANNPFMVIPTFDRLPVAICFYIWSLITTVGAAVYSVATPLTMAMYNWSSEEAVTTNAILQTTSCLFSALTNFLVAKTPLGKVDRRIQVMCGLSCFMVYMIVCYPWFFYDGPLEYSPEGDNSTLAGGCPRTMSWCETTTRVPKPFYFIFFTLALGCGFPLIVSPLNALFSEIVGPRKQSFLQGMMTFTGSFTQFLMPLAVMFLYEKNGFRYVAILNFLLHLSGVALILLFFKRLVPLKMNPPVGMPAKYKSGIFYRM